MPPLRLRFAFGANWTHQERSPVRETAYGYQVCLQLREAFAGP
jgi:hypothetical protein